MGGQPAAAGHPTEISILNCWLLDGRVLLHLQHLLLSAQWLCAAGPGAAPVPVPCDVPHVPHAPPYPCSVPAAAAAARFQFEMPDDGLASCVHTMPRLWSLSVSFVVSVFVSAMPHSSSPPVVDRLCSPNQDQTTTSSTTLCIHCSRGDNNFRMHRREGLCL